MRNKRQTIPDFRRAFKSELHEAIEGRMIYRIEVPGLKLSCVNEVERWHWAKRAREVKRVRDLVVLSACGEGYGKVEPSKRASVTITALGKYSRRDGDGTWFKDVIDALVARPVTTISRVKVRRWGLITDDSRRVIGLAKCETKEAADYSVVITVETKRAGKEES